MKEECILNDKELNNYLEEVKACFLEHLYEVEDRQLNLFYDYIRFYKHEYIADSRNSFNYVFQDVELLSNLGLDDFKDMDKRFSFSGKHVYIDIKLLDIESSVLRYKLSYMELGINY